MAIFVESYRDDELDENRKLTLVTLMEMISVNDCSISVRLGKMVRKLEAMSTESSLNCFIVKGSRYCNDN